jgi:uncharacterized protein (TIGR03083 family)
VPPSRTAEPPSRASDVIRPVHKVHKEVIMSDWNAMTYEAKDNLLRVVRQQAEGMFALAEAPGAWEAPTACPQWQVRDIIGHLIDVTESYFVGFDAARGGNPAPDALGVRVMQQRLDEGAKTHRGLTQGEAMDRLKADFAKLMEICSALGPDDWGGLTVTHKYMGQLPAFFYPTFQLMDYGVHSWDIRQGTGRAHGLHSDTADMLVPFMFILWQATADVPADAVPSEVGIKITSGHNAGSWKVSAGPSGVAYEAADVTDEKAVIEFDPGSFVLTAFGRSNSGTIRGDVALGERYLNSFFRI